MLKAKIHRATVTQTDLNYRGSVTVDPDLLDAAGILRFEKVQVVDIDNGARLETYCLAGERGSGVVCLNGAAARLASVGDKVIIMAYCALTPQEAELHAPRVVLVGEGNRVAETLSGPPA
jgi:aspartate 1-decarboxylase